MIKNYYLVLGIASDATLMDIKDAYRRLVKEYHPDHFGEKPSPFLDIQEAYSVLSDPAGRRHHDSLVQEEKQKRRQKRVHRSHAHGFSSVEPLIPESTPGVDLGTASMAHSFHTFRPSFDQLFDRIFQNFDLSAQPKGQRPENLTLMIPLTPEQAFSGGRLNIAIPAESACPTCLGKGWIKSYECLQCSGSGKLVQEYPVPIQFPSGITDHHTMILPLDCYGIRNLYLTVCFRISDFT